MAKQAILDVLEKTIGKYVKNLDPESLNVAVWKGQIELQSLELDLDAINTELARQAAESPNLAIPFRVVEGGFGSLQVDVPWTRITSQSVVLRAKGLKVIVEPYDSASSSDHLVDAEISGKNRIQKAHERRMQSLQSADEYRKQANALRKLAQEEMPSFPSGVTALDAEQQASFTENLVRRIIENIQLDVEDVHISVKDAGSATGVVLKSFSLVTTDKDGKRMFVDRKKEIDKFLYKALQINGLGVYLDELSPFPRRKLSPREEPEHSYILAPLSFESRLRQAGTTDCVDFPKYLLRSELKKMSIMLSKSQLELANKIALDISASENAARPLFPEYRPLTRVSKESAKEWWIYAFRCIGRLNGRRLWSEFFFAFRKRKTYIPLYKRSAHSKSCPWLTPLAEAEKAQLDMIEDDHLVSIEGIMAWRTIADALVELEKSKRDDVEKKKKAKGGIMAALFGSKELAHSDESARDDEPPITLSIEELQELEAISMEQTEGAGLSKDSKLCDVKFVLGTFQINLMEHSLKNLAYFEMGTTTATFNANADGSYIFESKLASMELHDRVTLKTLFPTVMRNITSVETADSMGSDVFNFSLEKSKTGDQHLMLRLAAFEMVASQMLIMGVKQFCTLSGSSSTKKGDQQNPLLRRSISGSVDLFYDAEEGSEAIPVFDLTEGTAAAKEMISDTLSSALVDAWKNKTKEKKKWTVDCDVHAPILIIPESCSSPEANVLVFDFGRLKFDYGKDDVRPKVKSWFDEQSHSRKDDSWIDPGSIDVSDLTFTIGKAGDLHWRLPTISASDAKNTMTRSTVIEPLSGSLNFGVLSDVGRDVPSICAYGVIPVVGLSISPAQISNVLTVYAGWKDVISKFSEHESGEKKRTDHQEDMTGGVAILEEGADETSISYEELSRPSAITQLSARRASMSSSLASARKSPKPKIDDVLGELVTFHVSMALQRLSIRLLSQSGEGIEAHLVSVSASMSQKSDGSSLSRLRMGWFWVLDRFSYALARKQRLIAHSTLPLSAARFSEKGTYDILGALRQQGVFDEEYSGSSELADITLNSRGSSISTRFDVDPFSLKDPLCNSAIVDSTLDAKFSSLYIHWNPQAVKVITQDFSTTIESLRDFAAKETLPKTQASYGSVPAFFDESQTRTEEETEGSGKRSTMLITAELESFEILLRSAKDDEALYTLTMAGTNVQMLSSQYEDQSGMLVLLRLGDVRIATPETSTTHPAYRTLLGLAPDRSDSLLSIKYSMGSEAVQASDLEGVDPNKCDMCGEITLSPMRLVYIHAQVLTLVDYMNQGIVGVLTSQTVSSPSETAAVETPHEVGGDKFFVVKATGFDVIIPRSASNTDHLAVRAGDLVVKYLGYSGSGGSEAHLSLSDVTLEDRENQRMVNTPLRMTIGVIMPPADIGTMDDRAMRVTINMFQVEFLLTQPQYQRIMCILAENVGEVDPCLRCSPDEPQDGLSFDRHKDAESDTEESSATKKDITHAGVEAVDVQNRMFIDFNMDVLSLELCGVDMSDPIVHFAALESNISMKLLPDEETMIVKASLQDLTCDDRRLEAMDRPFRSLMNQVHSGEDDNLGNARDIFCASYKKIGEISTEVDVKLGSPRIVFIPDVVSAVLKFFRTEEKPAKFTNLEVPEFLHEQKEDAQTDEKLEVEVQVNEHEESVEAAFVSLVQGSNSKSVTKMSFAIKTANCSVVLIDMGNATGPVPESHASFFAKSRTQLIETIVFQGQFDAHTSFISEIQSGRLVYANAELHGECMEVYTAHGSNFATPIQIVEPGSVSVFFDLKPGGENSKELDVRLVTLSPIDITFSMQNAALINAIASSCIECFDIDETDSSDEAHVPLSEQEVTKIEALASALETTDRLKRDESSVVQERSVVDRSSTSSINDMESTVSIVTRVNVTMTETQVTIINDLQGLDEALFRISASNFVAGAEVNQGVIVSSGSMKETTFSIHVNTAIIADYFDPSNQLWVVLLKRPWEVTLKSSRFAGHRSSSERMSTIVDIEAYPCLLSFSEQFLVSIGAASRMWSIYLMATTTAIEGDKKKSFDVKDGDLRISKKALASTAARSLITSLPYAVENHSGLDIHFMLPCSGEDRSCRNGTLQYFRFEPPQGRGSGGNRRYGQDITRLKALNLFVSGKTIAIENIDAELSRPRHVHILGEGRYLVTRASKEGKTKVLHLSSPVDVHNCTSVTFGMSIFMDGKDHEFGVCGARQGDLSYLAGSSKVDFDVTDGNISKVSRRFGIPLGLISPEDSRTILHLSPRVAGGALSGEVEIPSLREVILKSRAGKFMQHLDVTCRSPRNFSDKKDGVRLPDAFVLQVRLVASILERNHPFIEIFLEPRLVLENRIPVRLTLRTPMPHTFKGKARFETHKTGESEGYDIYHELAQGDRVEVFTPGPSIALSLKCTDPPVGGRATDWMEGGWIDVPLVREFGLPEPLRCVFPFTRRNFIDPPNLSGVDGTEFFIVESGDDLSKLLLREEALAAGKLPAHYDEDAIELVEPKASTRKILFTICNYAVDHTGDILFEIANDEIGNSRLNSATMEASSRRRLSVGSFPPPFSAYSTGHRRITLLPHEKASIRLLHLTMEGDEGVRRSKPFFLEDLSTSEGGVDSTPIMWQDNSESGYYAYRKLVDTYQFEVHVIPDFILFNGSKEHRVLIKQQGGPGQIIEPGRTAPIKSIPKLGLIISIDFIDLEARTALMRVDLLGLRVAVVKSLDGSPLGSVAVQTVIGNKDSRLVVKLGQVKFGSMVKSDELVKRESQGMFDNDVFRFRIRWSELQVTLNEARTVDSDDGRNNAFGGSGLDRFIESLPTPTEKKSPRQKTWMEARREQSKEQSEIERQTQLPVCTIVFQRFTVDWQRVFKEGQATTSACDVLSSPERSQFSVIIHNVKILDKTMDSEFPVVFDSSSSTSFFDLCVRCRGPLQAELVKVDLFDLNLAHAQGKTERIVVQTTEEFIWKAIDVGNRIIVSTAELAGIDLKLEWDEENGGYIVAVKDLSTTSSTDFDTEASYTPPHSETLYDINKARVSPFEMVVSFRRRPQSSRYEHLQDVRGAKIMNYFTQRMKFKIDRAELKFSSYEASNIKGPPDRLIEILLAVYTTRMKYKVVSMLTAVSFEDWKNLAARDVGGDDFVEGDLLRVTGTLAGTTAGYVAKKVGHGLGSGVIRVTSALGDEIEEATDMVGARAVGAGVNSVVSGLGGGVGNTIKGVGVGTGKVFQGAGKGVGQIFGGVTGGATLMAKGIGKGIADGDGKAVLSGFSGGIASVGNGLGNGFESAVMGAADGVLTCGEGLASGVRSIGSGFANAFGDCCWGDSAAPDEN